MTEYEMKSHTQTNIILFGQIQSGKSQALNFILQPHEINNQQFQHNQHIREGTMFNKNENRIEILESRGMIIDFDSQSDKNQYNISILKELDEIIQNKWKNIVNLLILCIPLNDKLDEINRNLIQLLEMYSQQKLKTCIMITKCEQIQQDQRESYEAFWIQQASNKNLQIFFIENKLMKQAEIEFQEFLNAQIQSQKFFFWNNLNKNQQTIIEQKFNIARGDKGFCSKLCQFIKK